MFPEPKDGPTMSGRGTGSTNSAGSLTPRQRSLQKGASEDSVPNRPRRLHPAEKRAQQLRVPGGPQDHHSGHAMHALRRLSRADFSSIRRAGITK